MVQAIRCELLTSFYLKCRKFGRKRVLLMAKIIQIAPANGYYAEYSNPKDGVARTPLVLWGLTDDESVVGFIINLAGVVVRADSLPGFSRYTSNPPLNQRKK